MKKVYFSVIAALISALTFAQDKGADINVDVNKGGGGGNWYASPWVWIVGAAVFILLLVALTRGRGSRDCFYAIMILQRSSVGDL